MNPPISKSIFWDTPYEKIDWQEKASFVIERVLSHGNMKDWRTIIDFYGVETIKETAINARSLDHKTLSFLSNFFDLPQEAFRCYKLRQSHPIHYPS